MFRLPFLAVVFTFSLGVGPSLAWAWQTPDDSPVAPRVRISDETIDLVPAEQVVDEQPSAEETAEETPPSDRPRSVFSESPAPLTVSPPRQPTPPLQPELETPAAADVPATNAEANPEVQDEPKIAAAPTPSVDTTHLKATVFKGIEPGHTSVDELKKVWGEPQETKPSTNGQIMTFTLEPFPRIDATIQASHVEALVVYMAQPVAPAAVIEQLDLGDVTTVDVLDRNGRRIGDHFPERGVTLVLGQGEHQDNITRILLEPLRAESFLLRVKRDRAHHWQRNLNDLDIAIRLDEHDHRAWWLKAEALAEAGDDSAAMACAARAIELDASVPTYQLTLARLLAKAGKYDAAIEKTRSVLDNAHSAPVLKARAALLLGDMLADSPEHKFDAAMQMHQRAVEFASPLALNDRADMRRAAKHTLVEAHLAIADDIARGRWQKKEEIVPQWLARSRAIADELIANEQGDAAVLLEIHCRSLASCTWLQGKVDPTPEIQQLQAEAKQHCTDCDDLLFTQNVSFKLAKAHVDAVDIERTRKNVEKAMAYGTAAEEQLGKLIDDGHRVAESQFQLARLCFLLGSIEAVQRSDHAAAVQWYKKGVDLLGRPEPDADLAQTARRGEWLVSMGISFWQQGDQTQGLKLTELGAHLLESANREGAIGEELLAVPYHNLSIMYKATGDAEKSQEFSQLAAQINAAKTTR